jgi:hypothetical protein
MGNKNNAVAKIKAEKVLAERYPKAKLLCLPNNTGVVKYYSAKENRIVQGDLQLAYSGGYFFMPPVRAVMNDAVQTTVFYSLIIAPRKSTRRKKKNE